MNSCLLLIVRLCLVCCCGCFLVVVWFWHWLRCVGVGGWLGLLVLFGLCSLSVCYGVRLDLLVGFCIVVWWACDRVCRAAVMAVCDV